jgi:hypothetical protein
VGEDGLETRRCGVADDSVRWIPVAGAEERGGFVREVLSMGEGGEREDADDDEGEEGRETKDAEEGRAWRMAGTT